MFHTSLSYLPDLNTPVICNGKKQGKYSLLETPMDSKSFGLYCVLSAMVLNHNFDALQIKSVIKSVMLY